MDQKKIGNLISILRKQKGLTQQELGNLLGVSSKTISKWECGNGLPDITLLKEISGSLEITIEELLDGKLKVKESAIPKESRKSINKNMIILLSTLITLLILITIIFIIKNTKEEIDENNCTVIRTYYIDNVGKSNDENYLYITIHEFQVEGTYTLKLPMTISKNLEVGASYEFTFKTTDEYIKATTDKLFSNSEVINLKYSDKVGLDRTSKYYCNKKGDE